MADPGAVETDAIIQQIETRIRAEYGQAEREIQKKLDNYLKAYKTKDKIWQARVESGEWSKQDYIKWKTGQIAVGQRWEEMRDSISQDLLNTSKIAKSITTGYLPDVYALNHDYGTYQVETSKGVDTSYTLYSREAAERIFRDNPQMLPTPGSKTAQDIADGKILRYNNTRIQSAMLQSLLQGEKISDVATRVSNAVGGMERGAAIRNARTMVTSAQNAGRYDAFKRADNMGVDLKIEWVATLDMRTRHTHRVLDGQQRDVGEPFEVDGYTILYPAQLEEREETDYPQSMIWNCFTGDTGVATDCEIEIGYKHEYTGELIRVRTARGVDFTCTPNHPILTPGGWVAAASLHKGDNLLITRTGDNGAPARNGNVYHVHSSFETLHNTLASFGRSEGVPMGNFDFHGDIPTSDVEIVGKKGLLRGDGNTGIRESGNKTVFVDTNTLVFSKGHLVSRLWGIYVSALSFVRGLCEPLPFFRRSLSHANIHGFRPVSNGNVSVPEYSINDLPTTTIIRGELLRGLTGNVFVDNIVTVDTMSGRTNCHVYNLQTENGYYFVNSNIPQNGGKNNGNYYAIAKNCRCTLRGVVAGWKSYAKEHRSDEALEGMSYEEWKESKVEKTKPITRPDERTDDERAFWIRQYRGYGGPVPSGRDTTLNVDYNGPATKVSKTDTLMDERERLNQAIANAKDYDYKYNKTHYYQDVAKDLSDAQKEAIRRYTSSDYGWINDGLRGNADKLRSYGSFDPDKRAGQVEEIRDVIRGMTEALDKGTLKEDQKLYRGMSRAKTVAKMFGMDENELADAIESKSIIGLAFDEKGFCSTSIRGVTASFKNDINLEIVAPTGTKGMFVAPMSEVRSEREFILQQGTRFEIIGCETERKGRSISHTLQVVVTGQYPQEVSEVIL